MQIVASVVATAYRLSRISAHLSFSSTMSQFILTPPELQGVQHCVPVHICSTLAIVEALHVLLEVGLCQNPRLLRRYVEHALYLLEGIPNLLVHLIEKLYA